MTYDLKTALEKERPALVGYVRGIVRNEGVAEDLTQEAILRSYLGISELRDCSRLILGYTGLQPMSVEIISENKKDLTKKYSIGVIP
jgi:hypothetical protein